MSGVGLGVIFGTWLLLESSFNCACESFRIFAFWVKILESFASSFGIVVFAGFNFLSFVPVVAWQSTLESSFLDSSSCVWLDPRYWLGLL